jgi:ubiquitin-conjugating enzyme E2 Q
MGRKLFLRHIEETAATPPAEISHVRNVEEGVVAFRFSYAKDGLPRDCTIRLLAMDVDEYPDGNTYMVYTEDDRIDPAIPTTFEILSPLLLGKSVRQALQELSRGLTDALTRGQHTNPISVNDDAEEDSDADDFLEAADSDDEAFGLNDPKPKLPATHLASKAQLTVLGSSSVPLEKIRCDLRAVQKARFRLGVLGNLSNGSIVCVSIRVSKLGISEEAMQAWGLSRTHYFVLLIRFQLGYRDLQDVKEDNALAGKTEMRVALCRGYKPSSADAFAAFNQLDLPKTDVPISTRPLEPLFIGRPLNDLLRERFARVVNFRESCGFNWPSAEAFVNDIQGKALAAVHTSIDDYILPDDANNKNLPAIVRADAMEGRLVKDLSLPLVAMQFVLRHFVRCTEFCLVCHCKVDGTFEALKPYVCSKPLCLYQYMALGFGPSIEWELISQPYVVDLLVSFCYSAARYGRLKEFPVGIDLRVPLLPHYNDVLQYYRSYGYLDPSDGQSKETIEPATESFAARMDFIKGELLCDEEQRKETASIRVGDWIIVRSSDLDDDLHYRVESVMFPVITLSTPIRAKNTTATRRPGQSTNYYTSEPSPAPTRPTTPPKALPAGYSRVSCFCYSHSFDEFTKDQKHHAIVTLLDTLPPVLEMQKYLEVEQKGKDPSLKAWRSRISDSALNVLRWIIASNRSCIMQVDRLVQDKSSSKTTQAVDDRVGGMDDYMQFRFAQGAPDKEQRFVDCVKKETETSSKRYPTIFAWHGSPISNWHSIIRQGLRFDETLHGRAYGHGVYMSNIASTSLGYSGGSGDRGGGGYVWPHSALKISTAFSLNEIVNKPDKFVSRSPHYVVNDIDWIQTRYLFVKSELIHTVGSKPSVEYQEDPTMRVVNGSGQFIQIPITAVSKSRRPATAQTASKNGEKKSKSTLVTDQATAEKQEDDANSIISDDDDQALLESDAEDFDMMSLDGDDFYEIPPPSQAQPAGPTKKRGLDASQTDFVPGSLDVSNIKFLDPPNDATTSATKALMKWFKEALDVQETTPLHTLGWYINPEHITNMYQWIVELHSFDEKLPLAVDMNKAGAKSIVLEMRFTNQFPFGPPFIRVVKPRFLPFQQGGGGHVTDGGAICMELLTNTGWSAVTSLEGVLLQVRLAMSEEERPARLSHVSSKSMSRFGGGSGDSYGVGEAVSAYERACRAHGWKVPEGFNKFQLEESSGY